MRILESIKKYGNKFNLVIFKRLDLGEMASALCPSSCHGFESKNQPLLGFGGYFSGTLGFIPNKALPHIYLPKKRKEKRISLSKIGGKAVYQPPLLDPTGVLCALDMIFFFFFLGIQ